MTHKKALRMMDSLNDLGNAMTALKWPGTVHTDHGTEIPDTAEIYKKLYDLQHEFFDMETDLHDCVNELCYQCGKYHRAYEGSCDGCRWLAVKEGFRD